ncbi:uncharacterized protein BJ212DRAFT_1476716 [Suillus subaureus]|uniref:Uncharacterized protein n=1 Tax=Suillus subaureus TaxID=48587 RepID=A0A9P7EJV8_9AGAM|nr:uncharacterized protein BJ212DRAFT_1476716 [Suillus subaureus]KAG1823862.1 hypothetical protein BJ212DRAFT_1476716 [Suillus subaureus]
MSSTEIANNTFNLVAGKIGRLITRSQKLKDGDPTAKILAHEIAVTLATALAQHGNTVTLLSPKLLSCTAEICHIPQSRLTFHSIPTPSEPTSRPHFISNSLPDPLLLCTPHLSRIDYALDLPLSSGPPDPYC